MIIVMWQLLKFTLINRGQAIGIYQKEMPHNKGKHMPYRFIKYLITLDVVGYVILNAFLVLVSIVKQSNILYIQTR